MVHPVYGSAQSVLILGGTSEIGLAIAERLIERGAERVVLAGRNQNSLAAAAETIAEAGVEVDTARFDADDVDQHERVLSELFARHGELDVVVLAWGALARQADAEVDPAAAVALARTNYLGAVSALTVVASRLREQGHGSIVVLSSVAGERVRRSNYVYGSTKAGLDGFCQGLAASLAGSGVHLLIVRPGFVTTKMTAGLEKAPLATTAEAVSSATVSALAAGRDVVWVPAVLRLVMIVLRHLPTALFRRLPI
jgi:decaprenylphospho-beta-D-erythro-pentofuranosid-2-ulose 2-reductase